MSLPGQYRVFDEADDEDKAMREQIALEIFQELAGQKLERVPLSGATLEEIFTELGKRFRSKP